MVLIFLGRTATLFLLFLGTKNKAALPSTDDRLLITKQCLDDRLQIMKQCLEGILRHCESIATADEINIEQRGLYTCEAHRLQRSQLQPRNYSIFKIIGTFSLLYKALHTMEFKKSNCPISFFRKKPVFAPSQWERSLKSKTDYLRYGRKRRDAEVFCGIFHLPFVIFNRGNQFRNCLRWIRTSPIIGLFK